MSTKLLLFCVVSLILQHINTQSYQPLPILTATLTTSKTSENGASVSILDSNVVTISSYSLSNVWKMDIPSWMSSNNIDQIGFDMLINLNESWGFHLSKESTIDFTMYSDQPTGSPDKDIILSFSVDNSRYFSIFLIIDNAYGNAIYPYCGGSLVSGNINNIVSAIDNTAREYKAFGNQAAGDYRLQPNSYSYNNYWPITISMRNDPSKNRIWVTVTNPQITVQPNAQTCEYSTSFTTNKGLQIYIGADDVSDQALYFKQFKIDYSFQLTYPPTNNPTLSPTLNPTDNSPTISPTIVPTKSPTNNPTVSPTTSIPTLHPTYIPTTTPTSISPTYIPTTTPTYNPSISPLSIPPTLSPLTLYSTIYPTHRPSLFINGETTSPTKENAGSIEHDQTFSTAQQNIDDNQELRSNESNLQVMYYVIIILVILYVCVILFTIYMRAKKKKKHVMKTNERINISSNTTNRNINSKYNLRLDSMSPISYPTQQFVVPADTLTQQHFENNLTSVAQANDILMDDIVLDIVNGMNGNTKGQTPRLPPPPPKRAKSNEDMVDIQMAYVTRGGSGVLVDDDTADEDTEGTDEMDTNQGVMDNTFITNYDNNQQKNDKQTIGNDDLISDMTSNNQNVREDEFVIGSEGGFGSNAFTQQ